MEKYTEEQLLEFKAQHDHHRDGLIVMLKEADFIQRTEYSDTDDEGFETITIRMRRKIA